MRRARRILHNTNPTPSSQPPRLRVLQPRRASHPTKPLPTAAPTTLAVERRQKKKKKGGAGCSRTYSCPAHRRTPDARSNSRYVPAAGAVHPYVRRPFPGGSAVAPSAASGRHTNPVTPALATTAHPSAGAPAPPPSACTTTTRGAGVHGATAAAAVAAAVAAAAAAETVASTHEAPRAIVKTGGENERGRKVDRGGGD